MSRANHPVFVVLLALILWSCGDTTVEIPAAETVELDPNPPRSIGTERRARVVLPDDYSIEEQYPVVFLLHGYSANAMLQDILFRMARRVNEHQFILVMPDGTVDGDGHQFWNATPECCDFFGAEVDDVAYLLGLMDDVRATYAVQSDRVAFLGHSNGGYMSYRMACEVPDRIAGVAVLAGSVFLDEDDCIGDEPVSVLHMHGTDDEVVPYEYNLDEDFGDAFRVETVGAEEAVKRWTDKAGCDPEPPAAEKADFHETLEGSETEILRYNGCAPGIDIELWRINEGGHLLLGVNDDFRDGIVAFLLRER